MAITRSAISHLREIATRSRRGQRDETRDQNSIRAKLSNPEVSNLTPPPFLRWLTSSFIVIKHREKKWKKFPIPKKAHQGKAKRNASIKKDLPAIARPLHQPRNMMHTGADSYVTSQESVRTHVRKLRLYKVLTRGAQSFQNLEVRGKGVMKPIPNFQRKRQAT